MQQPVAAAAGPVLGPASDLLPLATEAVHTTCWRRLLHLLWRMRRSCSEAGDVAASELLALWIKRVDLWRLPRLAALWSASSQGLDERLLSVAAYGASAIGEALDWTQPPFVLRPGGARSLRV